MLLQNKADELIHLQVKAFGLQHISLCFINTFSLNS